MYVGMQDTEGLLCCAVLAAALSSGTTMLATGVNNLFAAAVLAAGGTNMFAATVLAADGTFGATALFELLPVMLGIGVAQLDLPLPNSQALEQW
jgi:hypothetical protein